MLDRGAPVAGSAARVVHPRGVRGAAVPAARAGEVRVVRRVGLVAPAAGGVALVEVVHGSLCRR